MTFDSMTSVPFFPETVSINYRKDKNNQPDDSDNDNDGFVTPHITYKIVNVEFHFTIYTIFVDSETRGKTGTVNWASIRRRIRLIQYALDAAVGHKPHQGNKNKKGVGNPRAYESKRNGCDIKNR